MGRPRTYQRDVALDRALEAFWAGGYTATSVRDLLRATRMPPASLYAEFGGKSGLFLAAVDRYVALNRGWYETSLCGAEEGLAPVRRHFEAYAFDGSFRGCLLVNALGEREEIPDEALARIDAFFRWLRDQYARHLRAARDRGELRAGADPDALAAAILAFDQGLAVAGKLPDQRGSLGGAVRAFLDSISA